MRNSVTYINRTHVFEWLLTRRGSKNIPKKHDVLERDWTATSNMITTVNSIVNKIGETYTPTCRS